MILAEGIPSPSQGVWYLGPLPLRAYAFAIILGILLGGWMGSRRYRARGGPETTTGDVLFWGVIAGIIGARIYHVISSPAAYFGPGGDPVKALYIWEGGLGIWGAIPAGALVVWWQLRKKGLRLATFADALAPGILVAQAIGRIGNYFNQELYGKPTTLPWGLQIDHATGYPPGTLFHPTFLYELVWNLIGAGVLVLLDRKLKLGWGKVFWLYVAIYTAGRGWIEYLRIDDANHILGLRLNVWTAIVVFLLAVTMVLVLSRRHGPGREPSPWLPGREPQAEDAEGEAERPARVRGAHRGPDGDPDSEPDGGGTAT